MQDMEELKVLQDSDRDPCMAETGRPPIPTAWVDINKGDSPRPNHRTRGRLGSDVCCNSSERSVQTAVELDDDRPEVTDRRR